MTVTGEVRRVLVVDDDAAVRRLVRSALEQEGFGVDEAADADEAIAGLARGPAVVLLDLTLPGADGLEILGSVREATGVPVILLTGRASEPDRVRGLDLGADDYVVKPFLPRELAARVRAVIRRAVHRDAPESKVLRLGDLVVDCSAREVSMGGVPVPLTPREFDLLAHLARSPRHVFSREELLRAVWPSSPSRQDPDTVTEHVRRLRRKLGDRRGRPRIIRTVRGAGYRLDPPQATAAQRPALQLAPRAADHEGHLPG